MTPPVPHDFDEFNPNNPYTALALLGMRVDNLGKEKEALERDLRDERKDRADLEERVAAMERAFQRGAGILMVIPVLGTLIGILLTYGKTIFAPWTANH
jgi:F0F1-type ATP synthase assembly protein I